MTRSDPSHSDRSSNPPAIIFCRSGAGAAVPAPPNGGYRFGRFAVDVAGAWAPTPRN